MSENQRALNCEASDLAGFRDLQPKMIIWFAFGISILCFTATNWWLNIYIILSFHEVSDWPSYSLESTRFGFEHFKASWRVALGVAIARKNDFFHLIPDEAHSVSETSCPLFQQWWSFIRVVSLFLHSTFFDYCRLSWIWVTIAPLYEKGTYKKGLWALGHFFQAASNDSINFIMIDTSYFV